jgi:phosphohistidine phosphatase
LKVLIVRHAKAAVRSAGRPDASRPLTREGIRKFEAAARGIAAIEGKPAVILTSPLRRARQTADLLAAAWGSVPVREHPSLAGGEPVLAEFFAGRGAGDTVALVGHEPQLSSILESFLGIVPATGRLLFKKGGACLVELDPEARPPGRLAWFLHPRILRTLGNG